MLVYLSVMVLCCILLYVMRNDSNKIRPLSVVFGVIWLMLSLQDGWGGDHDAYEYIFYRLQGSSYLDVLQSEELHGEIGFKILLWLMPNAHMGLVLGMGIWCATMAFFFYHFVPQKWWCFAILFVFFDKAILMGMTASFLRMAIASSCLVFAVYYSLNNKRLLPIGFIILGSFFHLSILLLLPIVFVIHHKSSLSQSAIIGIFVIVTVISIIAPSSWVSIVEAIVMNVDALDSYQHYFEESTQSGTKGLVLIILFYWIYWLTRGTNSKGYEAREYLMMYYALIRIAFDLLPAVGLSSRVFYYLDIYFFAGMMVLMNRLPDKDNKWGIAITLLLIFWYTDFRVYSSSERFLQVWSTYKFIF